MSCLHRVVVVPAVVLAVSALGAGCESCRKGAGTTRALFDEPPKEDVEKQTAVALRTAAAVASELCGFPAGGRRGSPRLWTVMDGAFTDDLQERKGWHLLAGAAGLEVKAIETPGVKFDEEPEADALDVELLADSVMRRIVPSRSAVTRRRRPPGLHARCAGS